jgi:hypothetical protein
VSILGVTFPLKLGEALRSLVLRLHHMSLKWISSLFYELIGIYGIVANHDRKGFYRKLCNDNAKTRKQGLTDRFIKNAIVR